MANSEKQLFADECQIDDVDNLDQNSSDEASSSQSVDEASAAGNPSVRGRSREVRVEDGEDREDGVLHWLLSPDKHVMGACRADERLKPLLKLNVSNGAAEDRLLAHLSQHFEPSEVGVLARSLCLPLVTIRVGESNKKGTLLCPTSARGNLTLMLLQTSELCISFTGDDGCVERLATLSTETQCSAVEIEEISADKSGRSFLIKIPGGETFYFWCSEKSQLLGNELLQKMKDIILRKPSLAELTGISESRLNCFAIYLQAYLAGSMSSFTTMKTSRFRHYGSQGAKTNPVYQGSLSPRSSSFKEGLPRSLSSLRSIAREKMRRRGESYVSCVESSDIASASSAARSSSNCFEKDKFSEATEIHQFPSLSFLDVLMKSAELPFSGPGIQVTSLGLSRFSPHYCFCPPAASSTRCTIGTSQLPISSIESLSLPPLSSQLSTARPSSLLASKPSLNLAEVPPVDFPPRLAEPLARLPLTMPTSQQILTYTPLICDPIVHIPVIGVCSSGQGYLVSAGPAMSTSVSPLNPNLMDPQIPDAESMLEKGARETLRFLINSSNQPNPHLLDVLNPVLTSSDDKQNLPAVGSRGLYSRDVDAIANCMTAMGMVSFTDKSTGSNNSNRCVGRDYLVDQSEKPAGCGPSTSDDCCSYLREERTD
ncbi:unnamed protein product [Fraxinus pennsylvanica]|uniref:Uncharacterized protein n=1 Tax=Fraxinus pennsylvanica TaxID=56036 RepID=A0AAD2E4V8_9LAMI|nr:unnamed protein product [Fraxinus pennsylvanica]